MAKELPLAPNMEHFRKQAKDLLSGHRADDAEALGRIKEYHPEFAALSPGDIAGRAFALTDAQLTVARLYAFPSWPKLKGWVDEIGDPLRAAWVNAIKAEDIAQVKRLLKRRPRLATSSHIEFDDPWRTKRFPTATLDYVAAGPWPQTPECLEWNKARKANMELLRLLVDSGAKPDGDSHHGHCLSWVRDPAVAAFLVEHGAEINRWSVNGGTPLNYTCWGADPERMRMLLGLGADPNVIDPVTNESCLHYAAGSVAGHAASECVRLLLEAGAQPNVRCIDNPNMDTYMVRKKLPGTPLVAETPLHRAAVNADVDCIRALLDHGADPSLQTSTGETPLDWARCADRPAEIVELLRGA